MVFSIFGSSGPQLRAMEQKDLGGVLRMMAQQNAVDLEEARNELRDNMEGIFVLQNKGRVVGFTSAEMDPHSEDVAWLSSLHVDIEDRGQGFGRTMFEAMADMFLEEGIRKLFITASEFVDERENVTAAGRAFYEKMGARLENKLPDYHADGESRVTFGLALGPVAQPAGHAGGALRFTAIEELEDSDAGWGLVWEQVENAPDPSAVDAGLRPWIEDARGRNARILFAAVPSDLCSNLNEPFGEAGFQHHGCLFDYFAPGINQEVGSLRLR